MSERTRAHPFRLPALIVLCTLSAVASYLVVRETRTFRFEALYFTRLGRGATFHLAPGPSPSIRFAHSGPYDLRLGYAQLPDMLKRLDQEGYEITAQARLSPSMAALAARGWNLPYQEKNQAGLHIVDANGAALYRVRYPGQSYTRFAAVPPLLRNTLVFVENRKLLDPTPADRNPAIEWERLAKAVLDQAGRLVGMHTAGPGASTLATQIEKFRHSPQGRTESIREKFRQMMSASVRAYLNGTDTLPMRRQILVNYLDTVPLAARAGFGEINGLGDGLRAWYGRDFNEVNALLADPSAPLARRALAYKQALSLIIAQRGPSFYLVAHPEALASLTDAYLRLLAGAGIITPALRDAALAAPLTQHTDTPPLAPAAIVDKASNSARVSLSRLLDVPRMYDLDRLDLEAHSTLDSAVQARVRRILRGLRDPAQARAAGLYGKELLEPDNDPRQLTYSFTLFERTPDGNRVRIQTDSTDQPLDVNQDTKLDLGSTAKVRTIINYLQIIEALHDQYGTLDAKALRQVAVAPQDHIGRWAIDYLLHTRDRNLTNMLNASLDRKYSASPGETFFTGGGEQVFHNFDRSDNSRILTVREALRRSVNLVFVRLMRDIVYYYMFRDPHTSATLLANADDPRRQAYLERFANREGSAFIVRFYRKYHGKSALDAEQALVQGIHPTPTRLAVIYRTIAPQASLADMAAFFTRNLPAPRLDNDTLQTLYDKYGPGRFDLADEGYLAGVHPLALWVVGYLRTHPSATLKETLAASSEQRQAVYRWLFKTRHKNRQDYRIKQLLEIDAFLDITRAWRRLGYPFESLVPSYATALGVSADRPSALAELMGIIVNDGVRLPTVRIDTLHFAAGTPFETKLTRRPTAGERVISPEIVQVLRPVLAQVVQSGTARRAYGAFALPDGRLLRIGGKTGTGDLVFNTYARGGALIASRPVSRSGTFVFYLGDHYFGTLTVYVMGTQAGRYHFTSALPVALLKTLAPVLMPLLTRHLDAGAIAPPQPPSPTLRPALVGD